MRLRALSSLTLPRILTASNFLFSSVALQHLHFPPAVLAVLLDFYTGAERVFSMAGAHTSCWAAVDCGIAQGCPLSPVLASALSYIWASCVASDVHARQVGALAYIDDRTLWLCKGQPLSCLQAALARSADFDRAFCFQLSLEKCALIPRFPASVHQTLAEALGFKVSEDLQVLGVRATFQGPWSLLRFQVRKVVLRARLLGWVTSNRKIQKHLILSLVVHPFSKALKEIRTAITQAFQKRFSREFARVCFFEALDWQLHPGLLVTLGPFGFFGRHAFRFQGGWTSCRFMRPASGGKYLIPEAPDVLRRLGWTMDFAGFELQRRDRPGFDGFQVVFQWLRQHYRQTMVAQTGRVNHRYHRDDPSLAAGLDLPAPTMDADYHFDGLLSAINMGLRATDRAAIGGGYYSKACLSNRRRRRRSTLVISMTLLCKRCLCSFAWTLLCSTWPLTDLNI